MKKFKKGFTLTELIVVFAIMGVLGSVLFAGYYSYVDKSKEKVTEYELTQIKKAVDLSIANGDLTGYSSLTSDLLVDLYEDAFDTSLSSEQKLEYSNNEISYTNRGVTYVYNFNNDTYSKKWLVYEE